MDKQKFEAKFDKINKIFGELLDKYEKANPGFVIITALQLIHSAVLSLKAYVENPEKKEITWDNPCVELQYPVEINWDELRPFLFTLTDKDLEELEKIPKIKDLEDAKKIAETLAKDLRIVNTLVKGLLKAKESFIFRTLTEDIAILRENGKEEVLLPTDIIEELNKLSEEERKQTLERVQTKLFGYEYQEANEELRGEIVKEPTLYIPIDGTVTDAKEQERRFKAFLYWDFRPLVIDKDTKKAYYPVTVGLEFYDSDNPGEETYRPDRWSEENRQEFWKVVLNTIKDLTPVEKFDFGLEPLPELLTKTKKVSKRKTLDPIVKIDRTTAQNILPIFIHKGIFTNYTTLPTHDEIIEREKKRLDRSELTFEEERGALAKVGEYKTNGYVVRDYGDYAIGFSSKLYIDYIQKTEEELKQAFLTPYIFEDMNKNIEEALKKIKLYKLAHKIAFVILAEVYAQKKYEELVIPKERIVELLGYSTEEKQIYQDIKDALLSLRWLDYKFWDYSYTDKKKTHTKAKATAIGNFIYNLREDDRAYTLWINKIFVGCVQYLLNDKTTKSKKERGELFSRGYFDYPTRVLPLTKNYSTSAYLLTQFLIRDSGNKKLQEKGHKVVAYKVERFIREANIQYKQKSKRVAELVKALKEIELIEKTKPTISELEQLGSARALSETLYIWVRHPVKALLKDIEGKLGMRNK